MIEREYDISGAIVFWSLQPTPFQAVREVFGRMGFADCVPNPRTDHSALENSIKAVYGTKNKTVVSRKQPKRNGVELVNIERNTQRNGYVTNFGAKVVGSRVKADYGFADEYRLDRGVPEAQGQADHHGRRPSAGGGAGEDGRHDRPQARACTTSPSTT